MLTNCFAACVRLTITVSEIQRHIGRKSSIFFIPPLQSTPPFGVPVGTAVQKNFNGLATTWLRNFKDIFIRFGANHKRVRRTDRHRMPTYTALMHMHVAVKSEDFWPVRRADRQVGPYTAGWRWGLGSCFCVAPRNEHISCTVARWRSVDDMMFSWIVFDEHGRNIRVVFA